LTGSLRALLSGLIDYAGMFPPARLPLEQAIRRYAADRVGSSSWMLSRFIAPAARLSELSSFRVELFARGAPFSFAALGRGGDDEDTLVAGVERDLADIAAFLERSPGRVTVDALELELPTRLLDPPAAPDLEKLLRRVSALVEEHSPTPLRVYYEGGHGPDWRRSIGAIVAALAVVRAGTAPGARAQGPGFKLRCGGLEASAIPPVEHVAFVVAECRDAGVPFKATAGLHHPVRRLDHELLAKVHGFFNVFGAGALAHARRLDEATIAECVADEDPGAFVFEDQQMRWRDQSVSIAEIAAARDALAHSFGSCSFDEPREDLRALGLM
jgi:hypothetical protein